jgi:hypothetical protein
LPRESIRRGRVRVPPMPRLWVAMMVILVACLIASMVIATIKLT